MFVLRNLLKNLFSKGVFVSFLLLCSCAVKEDTREGELAQLHNSISWTNIQQGDYCPVVSNVSDLEKLYYVIQDNNRLGLSQMVQDGSVLYILSGTKVRIENKINDFGYSCTVQDGIFMNRKIYVLEEYL